MSEVVRQEHPEEAGYVGEPPAVPVVLFALAAANIAAATSATVLALWEASTGAPLQVVPFGGGDATSLQITSIIGATIIPSIVGALVFLVLRHYVRHYRLAYVGLAAGVLLASFALPLSLPAGLDNALMLMALHSLTAALNVGGVLVGDRVSRVGWKDGLGE